MNKTELIKLIEGVAYDLDRMKAHLKDEQYVSAYELTDGIVNDAETLRENIGGKALKERLSKDEVARQFSKDFHPDKIYPIQHMSGGELLSQETEKMIIRMVDRAYETK